MAGQVAGDRNFGLSRAVRIVMIIQGIFTCLLAISQLTEIARGNTLFVSAYIVPVTIVNVVIGVLLLTTSPLVTLQKRPLAIGLEVGAALVGFLSVAVQDYPGALSLLFAVSVLVMLAATRPSAGPARG